MIGNPWHRLQDIPPFVLPEDKEMVDALDAKARTKAKDHHVIHTYLIPEPFVGRPNAPVVLLGNNPGVKSPETAALRRTPAFVNRMRNNLLHQLSDNFPFLYLDSNADIPAPSRAWWERKLKHLFQEFGEKDVARSILARSILAVEFFPYVSHRLGLGRLRVPSQEYSLALVRNALKQEAVIVLTRGERRWFRAIPQLEEYHRLVRLKEHQRATISQGNCRDNGYQEVVRSIKATV